MSIEDALAAGTPAPAPEQAEQPSATPEIKTEGEGAPDTPQVAETDEDVAARRIAEKKVRDERKARAIQTRFNEITAEKKEAQRQNEILLQLLQGKQEKPPAADGAPKREQFDDYETYLEHKAAYKAEQRAAQIVEERLGQLGKAAQEHQAASVAQTTERVFAERVQAYLKANPDAAERMDRSDVIVPDAASDAIKEMDDAPQILDAIAKDPTIAERLAGMSAKRQLLYLGELSATLKSKPPQVSTAPAPGKPVGAKASPTVPIEELDYDAFVKRRRQQIAARNSR